MLKRIISIILSALMLLMLCACKDKPANETEGDRVIGSGGVVDNVFDDVDNDETEESSTEAEEDPAVSDSSQEASTGETEPSADDQTEATEPVQTDPPAGGTTPEAGMTYEKFNSLSSKEKREYQESFGDIFPQSFLRL